MPRWANRLRRFGQGAQNALELLRGGRFSAPYRAPYDIADETPHARLRHYAPDLVAAETGATAPGPVLLIPPLMVTAEVYDISPELSAVSWLRSEGMDVWLLDFGSPEVESGGMERTLDDHVLSVDRAVDVVRRQTGRDVHLAGYSQGGMFVYQCAAYRKSAGLASLITFGSPVDIHRNLPAVRDDVASRIIRGARDAVARPLSEIEGLPGFLTSTGFRVLSAKKEVQQMIELVGILHDREALGRRESRRRFLAGEGFVAWPGPALRKFVDEFIVANRMADGGFIIGGRTVTLADIRLPVLCFLGGRDEIARPAAVRAIVTAAPEAEVHEVTVPAGHFGIVVGSRSLAITWPTVRDWVRWREGSGPEPAHLLEPIPQLSPSMAEGDDAPFEDVEFGVEFLYDLATDVIEDVWSRIGDVSEGIGETIDVVRWQLPRIAKLRRLSDDSRISISRVLSDQARAIPNATFFLWGGRAFTYADADERVTNVAKGLWMIGVRPGHRVAVVMSNRPTYLSLVAALSRVGAVGVLINPDAVGAQLEQAFSVSAPHCVVADPERAERVAAAYGGAVHVLGGGRRRRLPDGIVDMEALDVAGFEFPPDAPIDEGLGGDLALLVFTSGTTGLPKAARITNRRWALAALGAAAACRITTDDTVYCCLPLHHGTAMLIAVGGALVGGARLALAPKFSVRSFWPDVRRYGATVVFYVGEMCRYLVNAPREPGEANNPVRVFAGNGMREDVWTRVLERFEPERVVEFYASTEGNAVLVNLSGRKVGSVGAPLPGATEIELVRYDAETDTYPTDAEGRLVPCADGEAGVLVGRIRDDDPLAAFDGYADESDTRQKIRRDVFEDGDAWFVTGDLLRRDADGDYWFVDRVGDTFRWKGENVSTELVARVLSGVPGTDFAVAYGVRLPDSDGRAGMAAIQLAEGVRFDGALYYRAVVENLAPAARPLYLRLVREVDVTATFKARKHALAEEGADPATVDDLYVIDDDARTYVPA